MTLLLAGTATIIGGLAILLGSSRYGCATTPDSASYVAAATSLCTEGRMLGYDGQPFTSWPPLYPTALALVSRIARGDALDAVRWLGVVLFAMGSWEFFLLASRCLAGWLSLSLAWTGWALGSTLFLMFAAALSEALFIVLVLVFLDGLTSDSRRGNAMALTAASLACLTRYIGVVLPVVFVLWHVLRSRNLRHAILRSAQAALSLLPLGLWMVRNHVAAGTPGGPRGGVLIPWQSNLLSGWDVLTQFLLPARLPIGVRSLVLGAVLGLLVWNLRSARTGHRGAAARLLVLYATVYGLLLTVFARVTYVDVFDFRLMSPLYPAVILLAAWLADRFWESGFPWARATVGIAAVVFILLSAHRAWAWTSTGRISGLGMYTSRIWQESRILEKTRSLPAEAGLFSNAPDAVYLQTGRRVHMLPSPEFPDSLCFEGEPCYVIWFRGFWRTYTVDLDQLGQQRKLVPEYENDEGGIYRLNR